MEHVDRFAALFPGYSRAHGVFRALGTDDRGKIKGRAITVEGPCDYAAHLNGKEPQGAIPLRDDCTVQWAAIDVDKYDLDIAAVAARVVEKAMPLVACASKSGGIHLYVFLREPQPADIVRRYLSKLASALGVGGSEIFPKQSERASAQDIGNWINLPYWKGAERVAWHEGRALTLPEFLERAEALRTTVESEKKTRKKNSTSDDPLDGAPPCLCHHRDNGGVPDGHKHEHLFTLSVYCRKRWPDDWKSRVHELQRLVFRPALTHDDVERVTRSVDRKEYDYECKGPWCDRAQCRRAGFGSGTAAADMIDNVTKILGDPVLWAVEMDGRRVLVNSDDLQSQYAFNRVCMDVLSRCPAQVPQQRWLAYVDSKIREADEIEVPTEANPVGAFADYLAHFLSSTARRAMEADEVLLGKVQIREGKAVFKITALQNYLTERRFNIPSGTKVWSWLRDMGARSAVLRVGDQTVRVCEYPLMQDTKL